MTVPRRSALIFIAALLVLGFADAETIASAQAQDKGRRPDKTSPAPLDDKGARVDEAMRVSGIRSHLALVRIRMRQILDEDPRVDYDARRWLAQTLDAAFSPETFAKPIRQALLDGYDGDALSRVLVWYRSATGRKIARLEQAAGAGNRAGAQVVPGQPREQAAVRLSPRAHLQPGRGLTRLRGNLCRREGRRQRLEPRDRADPLRPGASGGGADPGRPRRLSRADPGHGQRRRPARDALHVSRGGRRRAARLRGG